MAGGLAEALSSLLREALPGLFGGTPPAVRLEVAADTLEIVSAPEASEGEPMREDQQDDLPFAPGSPAGPYTLRLPPYAGPRVALLLTPQGESVRLSPEEVVWDSENSAAFTLRLRTGRDLSRFRTVRVLYGVAGVSARLRGRRTLTARLTASDPGRLAEAEALVLAAFTLSRRRLTEAAASDHRADGYGAAITVRNLALSRSALADGARELTLAADVDIRVRRALAEEEGRAIVRIASPASPAHPGRPIDIHINTEA